MSPRKKLNSGLRINSAGLVLICRGCCDKISNGRTYTKHSELYGDETVPSGVACDIPTTLAHSCSACKTLKRAHCQLVPVQLNNAVLQIARKFIALERLPVDDLELHARQSELEDLQEQVVRALRKAAPKSGARAAGGSGSSSSTVSSASSAASVAILEDIAKSLRTIAGVAVAFAAYRELSIAAIPSSVELDVARSAGSESPGSESESGEEEDDSPSPAAAKKRANGTAAAETEESSAEE
ncbi:hypothetical protein P152DRAFT_477616 [Eremomyces bilateralis CBS 781.70]|uniref:Uncharacterized protein n=1 Tax=Eremomyces bilateralis CBS 781.70 TaxID=1392243 RepID=A0A6G1FQQ6_9PEZI|nr:uncharacterized protein P152DRAFT_477616 [Eremomyces bilateralis CBS 781.70]KAF1808076.1 hypothetical protein P152DRAFT_477616 [Eremomyces bilateralis CBS 781.70]